MRRLLVAVVFTALAGGCAAKTQSARSADQYLDSGDWAGAEAAYGRAMSEPLAEDEFAYIRKQRCKARAELAKKQLPELEKDPSYEAILQFRQFLAPCSGVEELEQDAMAIGATLGEKDFVAEVEPLLEKGQYHDALNRGAELLAYYPLQHERREWFAQKRAALAQHYREQQASVPSDFPVTKALFGELSQRASGGKPTNAVAAAGAARVATYAAAVAPTTTSDDCRSAITSDLGATHPPKPEATAYQITNVSVVDCKQDIQIVDTIEHYSVIEKQLQTRTVAVQVQVPVTTTTTTHHMSCADGSGGYGTDCKAAYTTSDSSTTYETKTEYHQVEEWVDVEVPMQRPAKQGNVTAQATVRYTVQSADGTKSGSRSVTATATSGYLSVDAAPAALQSAAAGQTFKAIASGLTGQANTAVNEGAARVAKELRAAVIRNQADEAIRAGDTPRARELLLTSWAATDAAATNHTALAGEPFRVDVLTYASSRLPGVTNAFTLDADLRASDFTRAPLGYADQALVDEGFPLFFVVAGLEHRRAQPNLVGQADRSDLAAWMALTFRSNLIPPGYLIGAVLGFDTDFTIGGRLSEDYQPVREIQSRSKIAFENEPKVTAGVRVSALGVVGLRTSKLSVLGGLRPTQANYAIGYLVSEGAYIPLAGRIEIRASQRFPIIIEGWYGNVLSSPNFARGGLLQFRAGETLWIFARGEQVQLPARIPGLSADDFVFVPEAQTIEGQFGLAFYY